MLAPATGRNAFWRVTYSPCVGATSMANQTPPRRSYTRRVPTESATPTEPLRPSIASHHVSSLGSRPSSSSLPSAARYQSTPAATSIPESDVKATNTPTSLRRSKSRSTPSRKSPRQESAKRKGKMKADHAEDAQTGSLDLQEFAPQGNNVQRLDHQGKPIFTTAQRRLFDQVYLLCGRQNRTLEDVQTRYRGQLGPVMLYKLAMSMVSPDIETGLLDASLEMTLEESEHQLEHFSELQEELNLPRNGDLSIPTWAKLLKNAERTHSGHTFTNLVGRCIKWCNTVANQPDSASSVNFKEFSTIDAGKEAVQTIAQLRHLINVLTLQLKNSRALPYWYKPDHLQILKDLQERCDAAHEGPVSTAAAVDGIDPFEIIAVLKFIMPIGDAKPDQDRLQVRPARLNGPKMKTIRYQAQQLISLIKSCSDDQLDYASLVQIYRRQHVLTWTNRSARGSLPDAYFEPFAALGRHDDPVSALSVIIGKEKLLRWAKAKYSVQTTEDPQGADTVFDEGAPGHGNPQPKLMVSRWLFIAILRMLADEGRTASIRFLIHQYLISTKHLAIRSPEDSSLCWHPSRDRGTRAVTQRAVIPATWLLNTLLRSRNTGKELTSETWRKGFRDVCELCLPAKMRPASDAVAATADDNPLNKDDLGRVRDDLPLLQPDEQTVLILLNLFKKQKSAVRKRFQLVRLMEAYFGAPNPETLPATGWGKIRQKYTAKDGKRKVFSWHCPLVDREDAGIGTKHLFRPIRFTCATAKKLMSRARTDDRARLLCLRALLISRRWEAQEKEAHFSDAAQRVISLCQSGKRPSPDMKRRLPFLKDVDSLRKAGDVAQAAEQDARTSEGAGQQHEEHQEERQPQEEQPQEEQPQEEHPQEEHPQEEHQPQQEQPQEEQPQEEQPQEEQPQEEQPQEEHPQEEHQPQQEQPQEEQPQEEHPQEEHPQEEHQQEEQPHEEHQREDRQQEQVEVASPLPPTLTQTALAYIRQIVIVEDRPDKFQLLCDFFRANPSLVQRKSLREEETHAAMWYMVLHDTWKQGYLHPLDRPHELETIAEQLHAAGTTVEDEWQAHQRGAREGIAKSLSKMILRAPPGSRARELEEM